MKKVLVGAAVGIGVAYVISKLYKEGKLDGVCNEVNHFASKTKRDLMNAVDTGRNQAEYIKDQVEYKVNQAKEKFHGADNE